MDVNELKILAVRKKTNFSQIAERLGMTKQGFSYAIMHDTLKPDKIKVLSEILDIEIVNGEIKPLSIKETTSKKETDSALVSENKELKKEISKLKTDYQRLEENYIRLEGVFKNLSTLTVFHKAIMDSGREEEKFTEEDYAKLLSSEYHPIIWSLIKAGRIILPNEFMNALNKQSKK